MNDYPLNGVIVSALLINVNNRFRIPKYLTSSIEIDCGALLAIFINVNIAYPIFNLFNTPIIAGLSLRFI